MRVLARLIALLLTLQLSGAAPAVASICAGEDPCALEAAGEDGHEDGDDCADCAGACGPCLCCHPVVSDGPRLPLLVDPGPAFEAPSTSVPGRPLDGVSRDVFLPPRQ